MKSVQCIYLCFLLYFKGLLIKKIILVLWFVGKFKIRFNICYICVCEVIVIIEYILLFYILLRMQLIQSCIGVWVYYYNLWVR